MYFLDAVLFSRALPWYKDHVRGPHLPFEHLDEELRSKAGWPPIGDCKNNEIKIGGSKGRMATICIGGKLLYKRRMRTWHIWDLCERRY